VKIANPLSVDQDALRTSLVIPGLLEALERNQRHGARDIQLFETGRTFSPSPEGPTETPRLALLLSGNTPRGWAAQPRLLDFFDLKRTLEDLLGQRPGASLTLDPLGVPPFLHPGRSAIIRVDGIPRGYIGEVHPDTVEAFSLKDRPVVAEILLQVPGSVTMEAGAPAVAGALSTFGPGSGTTEFTAPSRFPAVVRDLSILALTSTNATDVLALAREKAGANARQVKLIDRFEGAGVPEGQVSLTLSFVFQDEARTLSSEEVEHSMDAVRASFSKAGYSVRGVGPS
jgi:phenylalanyl-tRNA synthetase beta chain